MIATFHRQKYHISPPKIEFVVIQILKMHYKLHPMTHKNEQTKKNFGLQNKLKKVIACIL